MSDTLLHLILFLTTVSATLSLVCLIKVFGIAPKITSSLKVNSDLIRDEIRQYRTEQVSAASTNRIEITQIVSALGDRLSDQITSALNLQNERIGKLTEENLTSSVAVRDGLRNNMNDLKTELMNSFNTMSNSSDKTLHSFKEAVTLTLDSTSKQLVTQLETFSPKLVKLDQTVSDSLKQSQTLLSENLGTFRTDLNSRISEQNIMMSEFNKTITSMSETAGKKSDELRAGVEQRLSALSTANEQKLEQMRVTVDEKLQSTLEKRLGESFKLVSDRLDTVHKGLGEMQTLANGVGDLKKVLTNVKSRGTWGEIQLSALLEEILTADQFEKNVRIRPRSSETVEFAIKLPGTDDKPVYLPIDSKFPKEDFERLQAAQEIADLEAIKSATAKLEIELKRCARDIREKYIHPPYSTDFAVLFLPVESLYAEVLRLPDVISFMQRECRTVIAGPNTLAALLNSLQMGFRTLAIQKSSSEVWKVLGGVKTEFGNFAGLLEKASKQIDTVQKTIDDTAKKSRGIEKKLLKVEMVAPADEPREIQGVDLFVPEPNLEADKTGAEE